MGPSMSARPDGIYDVVAGGTDGARAEPIGSWLVPVAGAFARSRRRDQKSARICRSSSRPDISGTMIRRSVHSGSRRSSLSASWNAAT